MLEITIPEIPEQEYWDPVKEEFIKVQSTKSETLQLEHSLISLSKWESKWHKPFISSAKKTTEETIDYIRCMTMSKVKDPSIYDRIPESEILKVNEYIDEPMTATTFPEESIREHTGFRSKKQDVLTAEILYYDMIALNIPFECQKWHLNRLITLIKVCQKKSEPAKKKNRKEIMAQNRMLNEQRKARMHTKG